MKISSVFTSFASLGIVLFSLSTAEAAVSASALFSDNAVLQRGEPIPVWGWADPDEKVTVTLGEKITATATADKAGEWKVSLPKQEATAATTLTIAGASHTIELKNIAIGDVWMCSGQSNMEWGMCASNAVADIAAAEHPWLRYIRVPRAEASSPQKNLPINSIWKACTPATAYWMTAVGFYFASAIHKEIGVPIGLIDTSWGGSPIEPYLTLEAIKKNPELQVFQEKIAKTTATYRQGCATQLDNLKKWCDNLGEALKNEQPLPDMPALPRNPASYIYGTKHNAMVAPCIPAPITGAIWYQGESNHGQGLSYQPLLTTLINGWRDLWGKPNMPFYVVELANYMDDKKTAEGGDGYALRRLAQLLTTRALPHSGMSVTIDIGETADVHPKNKFDVGERLAKWALFDAYGKKEVLPSGPQYKSCAIEGSKIRVQFDYVGKGLMVGKKEGRSPVVEDKESKLSRFAICGEDKVWHWAEATIDAASILVSSPEIAAPIAVRYAYSANPLGANLYNCDGLPAAPFATDLIALPNK